MVRVLEYVKFFARCLIIISVVYLTILLPGGAVLAYGIGSESMIQLFRSSITVWEAEVVSSLVKDPTRDFINVARCFTTKFFRNTPLVVLDRLISQLCGGDCMVVVASACNRHGGFDLLEIQYRKHDSDKSLFSIGIIKKINQIYKIKKLSVLSRHV